MKPIELPDVTLVSVDTVCHELSRMAVTECTKRANFGDVKIFTDKPTGSDVVRIEPFADLVSAGRFTVYDLPSYIKTSHVLFIHYDSWILDPSMWDDEFLKYDYIGAPWWRRTGLNVGNSGFCLRSLALMDFMAKNEKDFPLAMPEDHVLCIDYQPKLPQFKWAPQDVAQRFSFERVRPAIDSKHFGYHGMFNWPFVLSYDEFNERMAIARQNKYLQTTQMLQEIDGLWFGVWGHLLTPPKIYKGV